MRGMPLCSLSAPGGDNLFLRVPRTVSHRDARFLGADIQVEVQSNYNIRKGPHSRAILNFIRAASESSTWPGKKWKSRVA
jgi:hypothetical protein